MSVVLSVEETGPCERQVKVEVPAPAVEAELDRVTREYRKQVRLPGFRKGKVPLELVRKKHGEEIEKEVLDRLLPRYWRQAQAETRLDALLPPRVEQVVDLEAGEPLTFVAVVETRPEIRLDALDGFQLPEVDVSVGAEEVDRALEDIRRQVAEWVVVDRPAARGDLVVADMIELGGDAEQGPQRVAFEVGDEEVWEELSLEVSGKAAGSKTEFSRTEDEGELTRSFRIEVVEVKERDLPPLDDSLAAKVGELESLQELRDDVEARLAAAKRRQRTQVRERSLLEQLEQRHPIPLPEGLVERELEHLLHEYADHLRMRGVDPESADVDWRRLAGELRPQAGRRVHARLLLDAAAEKLELSVEEAELESALGSIAKAQGRGTQVVRQALARDGRLKELRSQLLRQKTVRRLLGEDGEQTEAAAGEPGAERAETAGEE